MLPVVAGLAYELLKFAAKSDALFFRIIRWPGMMLQKLTTSEPEDAMVEVAIIAFKAAEDETDAETLSELAKSFYRPKEEKAEPVQAQNVPAGVQE